MMRRAKTQLFSRRHQQSHLHQHPTTTQPFTRSPLPIDDPHHDHDSVTNLPISPPSHHDPPHLYAVAPPSHAQTHHHHHGDTNNNHHHHHIQHQHHKSKRERDDSRAVFDGSRSRLGLSMGFKGFLSGSVSRKSHTQQQQQFNAGGNTSLNPPSQQPPPMMHASSNTVAAVGGGGRTGGPMDDDEFDPVRNEHASLGDLGGGTGGGGGGGSGGPDGAAAGTTKEGGRRKGGGIHSSSQIAVDFFKWGKKRRQVFGTRAGGGGPGMMMNTHHNHHPNNNSHNNHNHFQTTHDHYNNDDPHGLLLYPSSPPHASPAAAAAAATAHSLRNSLVSTDAPPLRYSNSNLCIAGWLSKRGKRLGSRVDRFFQLNGSILSNSRSETSRPTWFVNVRGSKVLSGPGKQIIFKVNKTFTSFYAPTDELHDRWMRALQAVCGNVTDFYDFGKLIGRGAYSEVFIARDKQRNELCAVKVLERSNGEHAKLIDRELAVLRMLNHANIVQIYDIFDSARETYVVMEYLAGGELLDLITESDHLSERNSKHVIREVLQAIQYLHARGIVHRDVKPENILCVNRAWPLRVKLTDFGLSKLVGLPQADGSERVMRSQCGTAYYLAPEIANNTPYSKPVDLWACGVVLYVMLAGKFPFYGDTDEKFMRRLRAGVKFPDKEWAAVSSDAKSLVRGLLDPKPDSRLTALQALQHRWLGDDSMGEVDVTSSSVPSVAAQRSHHRARVQYDAITEPLSLQLAEFAGGRGHSTKDGGGGGGSSGSGGGGGSGSGSRSGGEKREKDNGGKQQHKIAPHDEFGESEAHLLRTDHHPYGGVGGASHLPHHYNNHRTHPGSTTTTISGNTTSPHQQQLEQQRHQTNNDNDVTSAQPQAQPQQQPFHYHHVATNTPSESAPDLNLKRAAAAMLVGERDDLDLSLGGRAGQSDAVLGGYNNFSGGGTGYGMMMNGEDEMHHHHHQQRDRSLTMSVIMDRVGGTAGNDPFVSGGGGAGARAGATDGEGGGGVVAGV